MNRTDQIGGITITTDILSLTVFQIVIYMYVSNVFGKMFGGYINTDFDKRIEKDKRASRHKAPMDMLF